MKIDREVRSLLRNVGARLKRHRKHFVYEMPDGQNVVLSGTPKDPTTTKKKQITDIKRAAGIHESKPAVIREKKHKPGRHGEARYRPAPPPNNAFADQLRTLGVTEKALRQEIADLQETITELRAFRARCLLCRLRDWLTWKFRHKS